MQKAIEMDIKKQEEFTDLKERMEARFELMASKDKVAQFER